jgi:chemotaxis protein methyltransferase CheR
MTQASASTDRHSGRPIRHGPSLPANTEVGASATGPDLDWIATTVTRRTGLTFPASRLGLLERAVQRWLVTSDDDTPERIARRVLPSDAAWRRLVSLVTVGETYFFRHEEQLEALRREILPEIVRDRLRSGVRRLRIWSAGCATGAEAYTLAMLLLETVPEPRTWDLRVLGTDIDEEALGEAKAASYGHWALRVDGEYRIRWLRIAGEGRHEVVSEVRSLVVFAPHNLVSATDWPPAALDGLADLILCRNVTMYMDPATARQVVDDFRRALAPGGWLMLSPAEPAPDGDFVRHSVGGFVFSRMPDPHVGLTPVPAPMPVRPTRTEPPISRKPTPRRPSRQRPIASASSESLAGVGSRTANAFALADRGRLDEAEAIARDVVRSGRPDAKAFWILATIAEARGELDAACHALGRVLYFAPSDPLALFRLGLLEWRRGRLAPARARMRATLAVLEHRPDTDLVDGDHGITAGAIRGVARSLVS